ncbi:AraC family transcriptional regulator [Rhodococcus sp. H29-C3]|uniref:AraC family transcriptional regulator n=1 Tax=Rhodococcus sp. H29-C3 TaxID=3046307 RepID=UPI0024B91837|nr:AraC family transcriptional regulator [Rhodococcus sp. H29-C3]MDJ0362522.1 AraC family transcriptional regulator [Rhodococcus sp. H29-C3]
MLTTSEHGPMAGALDRALNALEWHLHGARRDRLVRDEQLSAAGDGAGFTYVLSGRAEIRIGTTSTEMAEGDLMFFSRGIRRQVRALAEAELLNVTFEPSVRERPSVETLPDWLVVWRFDEHEPNVVVLVENMARHPWLATDPARVGDGVICGRIALTVVSAAVRSWSELGCAPERWLQRVMNPHLARALDALHADPGEPWTVDSLARVAAMSRSAFAERFRVAMGQSPAAYLAAVRMDAAADLLTGEQLSVAETAQRLGYESEAGFSRAFRRHTGSTPSQWRLGFAAPVVAAV